MKRYCIDASVFLGMNADDEVTRISCKNFFIENSDAEIFMSFEQIGLCDNVIWSYSFDLQALYYPFMDLFHTVMPIKRLPYTDQTLLNLAENINLTLTERLNISFAKEHNTSVYSVNTDLINKCNMVVKIPESYIENKFDADLEGYYQTSLKLVIDTHLV